MRQAAGAERDVERVLRYLDPMDQELHDARLLGREDLVPERIKQQARVPDLTDNAKTWLRWTAAEAPWRRSLPRGRDVATR